LSKIDLKIPPAASPGTAGAEKDDEKIKIKAARRGKIPLFFAIGFIYNLSNPSYHFIFSPKRGPNCRVLDKKSLS